MGDIEKQFKRLQAQPDEFLKKEEFDYHMRLIITERCSCLGMHDKKPWCVACEVYYKARDLFYGGEAK